MLVLQGWECAYYDIAIQLLLSEHQGISPADYSVKYSNRTAQIVVLKSSAAHYSLRTLIPNDTLLISLSYYITIIIINLLYDSG